MWVYKNQVMSVAGPIFILESSNLGFARCLIVSNISAEKF
jgi:hypothetical protein